MAKESLARWRKVLSSSPRLRTFAYTSKAKLSATTWPLIYIDNLCETRTTTDVKWRFYPSPNRRWKEILHSSPSPPRRLETNPLLPCRTLPHTPTSHGSHMHQAHPWPTHMWETAMHPIKRHQGSLAHTMGTPHQVSTKANTTHMNSMPIAYASKHRIHILCTPYPLIDKRGTITLNLPTIWKMFISSTNKVFNQTYEPNQSIPPQPTRKKYKKISYTNTNIPHHTTHLYYNNHPPCLDNTYSKHHPLPTQSTNNNAIPTPHRPTQP